jgi:hypothetical protein
MGLVCSLSKIPSGRLCEGPHKVRAVDGENSQVWFYEEEREGKN